MRPTIHRTMMDVAYVMAGRSTCSGRAMVGAVLTRDNRIIATGYNGAAHGIRHCDISRDGKTITSPSGACEMVNGHCVTAIHAEENAILQMCTTIGTTKGAFLYVTHSPCKQCAYRILQVGIAMVVYDKVYSNYDGIEILLDHHIAVNVLDQQGLLKPAGCGE